VITISTLLLIIVAIAVFFVFWVIWTDIIGAGWEPTSKILVRKMLEMAEVNSKDLVFDLGSGDIKQMQLESKQIHSDTSGLN
jgi:phospholipid N-methyltransferase